MRKLVCLVGIAGVALLCTPGLAAIGDQQPLHPLLDDKTTVIRVLSVLFLLAILCGVGMFFLFKSTYPSIDDLERLLNAISPKQQQLVERDTKTIFETVQYIVDAQNASWNMYLQYVVAVVIALLVVSLLLLQAVSAEAGMSILATIVGAAIGNAVTRPRPRESAPPQPPAPSTPVVREADSAKTG